MSMIVVSDWVMSCMDCGGFHFLAEEVDGQRIVTHPHGSMYVKFVGRVGSLCPNSGKRFRFPDDKPVEGVELTEEV